MCASMKKAYALNELHHDDVSVERTHAVFTTIAKIVEREVTHHDRRESIFACAFGLSHSATICNLIELFANLRVQTLTTINLFRNVQVVHYYTPQMIFTVYTSTLTILISDSSQARSRTIHSSIKLCLWPSE